jgi:hypothetical protein
VAQRMKGATAAVRDMIVLDAIVLVVIVRVATVLDATAIAIASVEQNL